MAALSSVHTFWLTCSIEQKPLVIIIPSYNNERWIERNLNSVFMQKYENYRVIYVDDFSSDKTYERALQLVKENNQQHRFTIIHNDERRNAMANWYTAIHSCLDEEIILHLDGDDWFANDQVLAYINHAYSNPDIWFTYGQYKYYPADQVGDVNKTFPQYVIDGNAFRQYCWFPVSHLRTHYAWLFKIIKLEDFLDEDYFYDMTCDKAMLAPMIEMAALGHFLQIHDVLYMYNNSNPINDERVNVNLQFSLASHIFSKTPYQPLHKPESIEYLDQRDHVSFIVLCTGAPNFMRINGMLKKLGYLHGTYVLVPADIVINNHDLPVTYVSYDQEKIVQKLCECLTFIDSRFILLSTDSVDMVSEVDLPLCLQLLKKTHTSIFYLALGYESEDRELFTRKRLPRVSHEFPVFAWYSGNKNDVWQIPAMNLALWHKHLLSEVLSTIQKNTSSDLKASLDAWLTNANILGLLFDKKIVT